MSVERIDRLRKEIEAYGSACARLEDRGMTGYQAYEYMKSHIESMELELRSLEDSPGYEISILNKGIEGMKSNLRMNSSNSRATDEINAFIFVFKARLKQLEEQGESK